MNAYNISFTVTPVAPVKTLWCVYMITDPTRGTPIKLDVCKLWQLFTVVDIDAQAEFVVTVLSVHSTVKMANSRLQSLCVQHGIKQVLPSQRRHMVIECSNGQKFPTVTAAAKALGLTTSALSKHLNGVPSYNTVGGWTFKRVPALPTPPTAITWGKV